MTEAPKPSHMAFDVLCRPCPLRVDNVPPSGPKQGHDALRQGQHIMQGTGGDATPTVLTAPTIGRPGEGSLSDVATWTLVPRAVAVKHHAVRPLQLGIPCATHLS